MFGKLTNVGISPPTDRTRHQTRSVRLIMLNFKYPICFNFGMRKEVVFILFPEQEKEEGGEFYSLQRFSPDLAVEGEFGYEHILYEN